MRAALFPRAGAPTRALFLRAGAPLRALALALLASGGVGCEPGAHGASGSRREALPANAAAGPAANRAAAPLVAPGGEAPAASAAPGSAASDGSPSLRALEPCLPQGYEVCFNALDDNCNGALEEGCGVPAGVVQFMIGWDALRADVDLNVTDPNGELIEAGRVVRSGLIKTRDCPGRRQECSGVNLENVFLEGNKAPTRGTYRVSVALESLGGEQPPIWVNLSSRLGARRYAFEIRLLAPEDERHVELTL